MKEKLDTRRIFVFLFIAFGIAWATALVIYLTGGLVKSMPLGGGITLAFVLLATTYMGAPAIAHILTRLVTREGWKETYLRPKFKQGWRYWIICWIAPSILIIAGMAVYFAFFPQHFDPSLGTLQKLLKQSAGGMALPQINPWTVVISQTILRGLHLADRQRTAGARRRIRLARLSPAQVDGSRRTQGDGADGHHLGHVALARDLDGL